MADKKVYPSDVSDEEWAFILPYLTLMKEDAPQREHELRDVFNALRWICKSGAPWRYMPGDFPPWHTVYQQTQRWLKAGVFQAMVHDLRELARQLKGKKPTPTATILDARTLQSTPESGSRAGFDGHKKRKGSKTHIAVDTLGNLLSVIVTPANEQDRSQVDTLLEEVQEITDQNVDIAFVDQGYTGDTAREDAENNGIELCVVKLSEAKRGFVLLPRRWVVERTFGWFARFRRLARDFERLPKTLEGLHYLAFATILLKQVVQMA